MAMRPVFFRRAFTEYLPPGHRFPVPFGRECAILRQDLPRQTGGFAHIAALGGLCGGVLAAATSGKLTIRNSYVLLLICSSNALF